MQKDADRTESRVLDGHCELVSNVVAMGRGVSPPVLPVFQVFSGEGPPKPVQVQGDGGTIDEDRGRSPPLPAGTAGVQECDDESEELLFIEPTEEPVERIEGGDLWYPGEPPQLLPGVQFSYNVGSIHGEEKGDQEDPDGCGSQGNRGDSLLCELLS